MFISSGDIDSIIEWWNAGGRFNETHYIKVLKAKLKQNSMHGNHFIDSDHGNRWNSPFYNPDQEEVEIIDHEAIAEVEEEIDYINSLKYSDQCKSVYRQRRAYLIDKLKELKGE